MDYENPVQDSRRWQKLAMRPDDIVISAPVKSGTTWLQTICALLVFQRPQLPAPLRELSPWIDSKYRPVDEVVAALERQKHRRVIKTHTPLDGIPAAPGVTVIAGARHPLDAAVSFFHHQQSLPVRARPPASTDHEWLRAWIDEQADPLVRTESLRGMLRMNGLAWDRRDQPGVLLVHYADLSQDLDAQMRRIAGRLGIDVPERIWPRLVRAASFEEMSRHADALVPRTPFKDPRVFFRGGRSGDGAKLLTAAQPDRYEQRATALIDRALAAWLHR